MDRFEFDPEKDRINLERHGIALSWAVQLWTRDRVIVSAKPAPGEERYALLAKVDGLCFMVVFARRGRTVRLISCHRADERRKREYEIIAEAKEG